MRVHPVVLVLLSFAVLGTFGRKVHPWEKGPFAIQNVHHLTYLQALENGKRCAYLSDGRDLDGRHSDVITSTSLNRDSEAFLWKTTLELEGYVGLQIDGENNKLIYNEVTMEDSPPNCYAVMAWHKLLHVNITSFMIKSRRTEKCLGGNGRVNGSPGRNAKAIKKIKNGTSFAFTDQPMAVKVTRICMRNRIS